MIVNRQGPRSSSKGRKGLLIKPKGKAQNFIPKSRVRFKEESSTRPAPSKKGPLPGKNIFFEKGMVTSNPFNSLSSAEAQMVSSEKVSYITSDGTTLIVTIVPTTLCVQSFQPPLPRSKEPPDLTSTASEVTLSLIPNPIVFHGDYGSELA